MARTRPVRYTNEQMIKALIATKGLVYLAAERLGCTAETIYARMRTSKAVADTVTTQREKCVDKAEQEIIKQINDGNTTALIFYLKTMGKKRGYVERQEILNLTPDQEAILRKHNVTAGEALERLINELAHADADD